MKELISWWSHIPEHINPIFLKIGIIQVHYYGLMYLLAFLTVYLLVLYRLKAENIGLKKEAISNYFTWLILAVLIGLIISLAIIELDVLIHESADD